jgi:beta propeller repeat protein
MRCLRAMLCLSLFAAGCLCEAWAGEVRLGTVPDGVTADISGDRVVWGGLSSPGDYVPWAASAYVCNIPTGEVDILETHTGSQSGTGFVQARVTGEYAASWGYCLDDPEDQPSLMVYEFIAGMTMGSWPVRPEGVDIDGDLLTWADYSEAPTVEHDDFYLARAGVAYLVACAMAGGEENVPPGPAEPSFPDVPRDHWAYRYVEYCSSQGIIAGFPSGSWQPNMDATRAQMAVWFCRAVSADVGDGPAEPTFADVPPDYWAYPYIEYLNAVVTDAASSTLPEVMFSPDAPMSALLAESWLEQGTGTPLDAFRILELELPLEGQVRVRSAIAGGAGIIASAPGAVPAAPAISGNRVVWEDKRDGQWDIYLCDVDWAFEQQTPVRITDDASDQMNPAVSGDVLVWQDNRSGNWDIYLYRAPATPTTSAGVPLTTDPADQTMPAVSGDLVVWQDHRNGNWDIYLYDLTTDTEVQLTTDPADQTDPRIDGRRIVYTDQRSGTAIYLYDLDGVAPTAEFSADVQAGYAPLTVQFANLSTVTEAWEWQWDFGDGQTSAAQSPSHTFDTVGTYTVSLAVTSEGGSDTEAKAHYILATFPDVPFQPEHWALHAILACVDAGIVQGYPSGNYGPDDTVSRAQMAVYISRALAGGDAGVPASPTTVSFPDDVPADHWAYRYVEYAVAEGVVQGYDATHYRPDTIVTRDQMAVFVARAKQWVTIGEAMNTAPELFSDVAAGFWCGTAVQACVTHGVVNGYPDGTYHPERQVTRDQMAVYIARAFELP